MKCSFFVANFKLLFDKVFSVFDFVFFFALLLIRTLIYGNDTLKFNTISAQLVISTGSIHGLLQSIYYDFVKKNE